jgi:hypothetical protein
MVYITFINYYQIGLYKQKKMLEIIFLSNNADVAIPICALIFSLPFTTHYQIGQYKQKSNVKNHNFFISQ